MIVSYNFPRNLYDYPNYCSLLKKHSGPRARKIVIRVHWLREFLEKIVTYLLILCLCPCFFNSCFFILLRIKISRKWGRKIRVIYYFEFSSPLDFLFYKTKEWEFQKYFSFFFKLFLYLLFFLLLSIISTRVF